MIRREEGARFHLGWGSGEPVSRLEMNDHRAQSCEVPAACQVAWRGHRADEAPESVPDSANRRVGDREPTAAGRLGETEVRDHAPATPLTPPPGPESLPLRKTPDARGTKFKSSVVPCVTHPWGGRCSLSCPETSWGRSADS